MTHDEADLAPLFRPKQAAVRSEQAPDPPGGWHPSLGAWRERNGIRFRVWAPEKDQVELVLEDEPGNHRVIPLEKYQDRTFGTWVEGLSAGSRYRYRVDDGLFPDPASRFQPEGVHGPSEVVDQASFCWTDQDWQGIPRDALVLYELHVGTFTPRGTFGGIIERLPYLAGLGITALELMPVADFPGQRNWGYDGVQPYAPARCYGRPDDLRRVVDEAHRLGLGVFLDVVYNHLGPEGNYLGAYSPSYFSPDHENPWGRGFNFDGPNSSMVREFFIENALHWVHEYHLDGLRLDATHGISDTTPRHFIAQLTARVRESCPDRRVHVIAEDHRNLAYMVKREGEGGWGLDGVWADDFHHEVRVRLAGDSEGYYRDYSGSLADLARTLNRGWYFTGQFSQVLGENRGTDPAGIPPRQFVFCIQNHDQIGNRAFGERLHHQIDFAAYRAASLLLLCAPATPLLFMGQEWATSAPFLYFTDHPQELAKLVTEGRRREFREFRAFRDTDARDLIPDPQAESTFRDSRLPWNEQSREPHASILRLYQVLVALRRSEPALHYAGLAHFEAFALSDSTLLLRHDLEPGPSLLAIVQMHGAALVDLSGQPALEGLREACCQLVLTTEDRPFAPEPRPPIVDLTGPSPVIRFARPSGVLLRVWPCERSWPAEDDSRAK